MSASLSVSCRLRRWRPLLWLAVLAVWLHAMLPFVHGASPAASGIWNSICSVAGVSAAPLVAPTTAPDAPAAAMLLKCPLCLAGAHLALLVPIGLLANFDPAAVHEPPTISAAGAPGHLAPRFFYARAPPFLA